MTSLGNSDFLRESILAISRMSAPQSKGGDVPSRVSQRFMIQRSNCGHFHPGMDRQWLAGEADYRNAVQRSRWRRFCQSLEAERFSVPGPCEFHAENSAARLRRTIGRNGVRPGRRSLSFVWHLRSRHSTIQRAIPHIDGFPGLRRRPFGERSSVCRARHARQDGVRARRQRAGIRRRPRFPDRGLPGADQHGSWGAFRARNKGSHGRSRDIRRSCAC